MLEYYDDTDSKINFNTSKVSLKSAINGNNFYKNESTKITTKLITCKFLLNHFYFKDYESLKDYPKPSIEYYKIGRVRLLF